MAASDESRGLIEAVTDEQILAAQGVPGGREGVFVEPASAAGVAGLLARPSGARSNPGSRSSITVTGHGLKDIDTALSVAGPVQAEVVAAELTSTRRSAVR